MHALATRTQTCRTRVHSLHNHATATYCPLVQLHRFQMWQQAKFGMASGTAVTVAVGAVTVPPLVAVMGPGGWAVGGITAVGAGVAVGLKTGR